MKLSTIFANAANFYLSENALLANNQLNEYSCNAIKRVIRNSHKSKADKTQLIKKAIEFAKDTAHKSTAGTCWFDGTYSETERIQNERYMWLSFLSEYAKDQGV